MEKKNVGTLAKMEQREYERCSLTWSIKSVDTKTKNVYWTTDSQFMTMFWYHAKLGRQSDDAVVCHSLMPSVIITKHQMLGLSTEDHLCLFLCLIVGELTSVLAYQKVGAGHCCLYLGNILLIWQRECSENNTFHYIWLRQGLCFVHNVAVLHIYIVVMWYDAVMSSGGRNF